MTGKTRKQMIEEMLVDQANDPELHYMLAMEHAGAGDDAAAVRQFETLVGLAPDHVAAYHQAGRALQRLGRVADARAWLTRGIAVAIKQNNEHAAGEMQQLLEME